MERYLKCPNCRTEVKEYKNPFPTADIIIRIAGKIVLVERRNPPHGWALPGGFVDPDETMEEAIRREMLEETSLHVTPERWLFSLPNRYEYGGISIPTADNFFLCSAHDLTPLCPHDDVASLLWLPLASLDADQFGLQSMRRAVPMIRQVLL